jgi:tRNA (guanine-N1)-methyltransferase
MAHHETIVDELKVYKREDLLEWFEMTPDLEIIHLYSIEDCVWAFSDQLVPDTGYIDLFELRVYKFGLLLRFPHTLNPSVVPPFQEQKIIYDAFSEERQWSKVTGIRVASDLNRVILNNEYKDLILLCGHYEGVDQRALDACVDEEISIGDYILTGGELAAMVLTDCVARFIPGVLGSSESPEEESFSDGLLEYPQYTRPRDLNGRSVPEVLLNGDHAKIAAWRRRESLRATLRFRPDLLETADLSPADLKILKELENECSSEN